DIVVSADPRQQLRLTPRPRWIGIYRHSLHERDRHLARDHGVRRKVGSFTIPFTEQAQNLVAPREYRTGRQIRFHRGAHPITPRNQPDVKGPELGPLSFVAGHCADRYHSRIRLRSPYAIAQNARQRPVPADDDHQFDELIVAEPPPRSSQSRSSLP